MKQCKWSHHLKTHSGQKGIAHHRRPPNTREGTRGNPDESQRLGQSVFMSYIYPLLPPSTYVSSVFNVQVFLAGLLNHAVFFKLLSMFPPLSLQLPLAFLFSSSVVCVACFAGVLVPQPPHGHWGLSCYLIAYLNSFSSAYFQPKFPYPSPTHMLSALAPGVPRLVYIPLCYVLFICLLPITPHAVVSFFLPPPFSLHLYLH